MSYRNIGPLVSVITEHKSIRSIILIISETKVILRHAKIILFNLFVLFILFFFIFSFIFIFILFIFCDCVFFGIVQNC